MKINISIECKNGQIIHAAHNVAKAEYTILEAPLIIMVRGFPKYENSTGRFFGALQNDISKLGYNTLQFDFLYSEDNEKQTQNFSLESVRHDIDIILDWAKNTGYQRVAFITEGLGAPFTLLNLPAYTQFCILCWPILDLARVGEKIFDAQNHVQDIEKKGYLTYENTRIGQTLLKELETTDIIPFLEKPCGPTLILQGGKDTTASPAHLSLARDHLNATRLEITLFDDGEYGLEKPSHRKACRLHIKNFIKTYALKEVRKEKEALNIINPTQ